ncbi:ABC transporter ATP-binding protein, partial [Nitratireductor pacificus]|uniref:ABC transporter ATP-binding protein n=1 Tax=Nitratireductor pacificus TaxID=1231180 RepID=UPI003B75CA82
MPVIRRIFAENGREYVGHYAIAIVCMLAIAATTAFSAWIMRDIIDEVFYRQRWELVGWICGAIIAAFAIRGFASYGQSVMLAKIGNNIVARYQQRMFDHLMRLGIDFFTATRSGQLSAQISQNVGGIRDLLNMTVASIARDVVTLVGLVAVMVMQDPLLSVIALVIGPPLIYAVNYLMRRLRRVTREAVDINSRLLGAMQESVQGIAIIKAFTMEKQLSDKMAGLILHAEERSNKIARVSERLGPITEILAGLAIAGVIGYAAWRASVSAQPPGSVFAFITALLLAYDPVRKLARVQVNLERALVNARMIYEILDIEPQQGDAPGAGALSVAKGDVVFDRVAFSYSEALPVLRGVSFTAKAGETTAIVGPSGAGKST